MPVDHKIIRIDHKILKKHNINNQQLIMSSTPMSSFKPLKIKTTTKIHQKCLKYMILVIAQPETSCYHDIAPLLRLLRQRCKP